MTARPGTETFAANLALGHATVPEIADMSVNTTAGRAVRLFFGQTRDDILRQKWWSFATGWHSPATDTVESLGPLKKRYALPADYVRIRYLIDDNDDVFDEDDDAWDIENGPADLAAGKLEQTFLVTNLAAARICYTRRIENVALWDPVFLSGFCLDLGGKLAMKLGRGRSLASSLAAQAKDKIDTAAGIDSKERSRQKAAPTSSWLLARSGFRRER